MTELAFLENCDAWGGSQLGHSLDGLRRQGWTNGQDIDSAAQVGELVKRL